MKVVFSPTFGFRPRYFVGRDKEIAEFMEGLAGALGHPNRATFFIGQRGMGKTVLLLELAERSREMGFIAVHTVAGERMLDEIIEGVQIAWERSKRQRKKPFKGVSAGALGFSIGLTFTEDIQKNYGFRTKLSLLCETMAKEKKGVLFLIDEVQARTKEMREFATTYQQLVGDGMNVAVAMAGLPNTVSSVLNDEILTFLNRAHKENLNPLQIADVSACFLRALSDHGIAFDAKTLDAVASATDGYPYLLQLIGYHMLRFLEGESELTETIAELAIHSAKRALASDVFLPSLNPLSAEDKRFLAAMAKDKEESRVWDIRERLNASKSHVQAYRKRLIDAGVIHASSRGAIAFSIPYLAQYLRGEI